MELQRFYYLMELHYSQTENTRSTVWNLFYYLMELHYSQTRSANPVTLS